MQLARKMEPLDISWFEEPVVPEDVQGYRYRRVTVLSLFLQLLLLSSLSLLSGV